MFDGIKRRLLACLLCHQTPTSHPLQERALVNWLVKAPTERDVYTPRKLTLALLTRLEEVWKRRPTATLDDMDAQEEGEDQADGEHVEPVALRWEGHLPGKVPWDSTGLSVYGFGGGALPGLNLPQLYV
jgi:hypothetical protein